MARGLIGYTSKDGTTRNVDTIPRAMPAADLDPTQLLRTRDGIYAADLLIAAITEYDFFDRLYGKAWSLAEFTARFAIAPRPLDVMLTLFVAMGLLEREDDRIRLSPQGQAFLTHQSRWDMGPYFASLKLRPQIAQIVEVLSTGRPARWESSTTNLDWASAMKNDAFAHRFTAAMNGRGEWLGPSVAGSSVFANVTSVLDIGGGSGVYARIIKEGYPALRVAVLEKEPVDRVAAGYLGSSEVGRQVEVLTGDMFTEIPTGFDVHLFSNVLHDWNEAQAGDLLRRSRAALPPGGRVVVHDAFIDRDKRGPLGVAEYSVLLMLLSDGKCYAIGEMESLLEDAGFVNVTYQETRSDRGMMTARVRDR